MCPTRFPPPPPEFNVESNVAPRRSEGVSNGKYFASAQHKKTSCHTLSQGFKESRIQSLRDSRTQALKESRTQAFKDSKAHGWKDSAIHVGAFVPRTTASDFPNSIFGSPQSKAYEDICSKALKCKRKSGSIKIT